MDNDQNPSPAPTLKNPDANTTPEEQENESAHVRVFDITPDLNISPAKDEAESQPPVKSATINFQPIMMPAAPVQPPEPPSSPAAPVPQTGPANPPAKTIVSPNNADFRKPGQPKSLQTSIGEAVDKDQLMNISKAAIKTPVVASVDPNVKALRTYERDIAEAMAKRKLSSTSIAIAESKKNEGVESIKAKVIEFKPAPRPLPPPTPPPPPPAPLPEPTITAIKMPPPLTDWSALAKQAEEKIPMEARAPIVPTAAPVMAYPVTPQSTVSVVDVEEPYRPPSHHVRNFFIFIFSLILVVGGAYAGYYLYTQSAVAPVPTPTPTPQAQFSAAIIPVDSSSIVNIEGLGALAIKSRIIAEINKPQAAKSLREIVITSTIGGKTVRTPAPLMYNMMSLKAPDILKRSLSPEWMLGLYSDANEKKSLFIVSTNDFFQNTFAGMLQWEKSMAEDLKDYLYTTAATFASAPTDNTASTSAASVSQDFTLRGHFVDRIIMNKDVREYLAENGSVLFLYSFLSNDKLVITDNELALGEIITRLEK